MNTIRFVLLTGLLLRGGLALYLHLSGFYDTARLPAVALMQASCLLAVALSLQNQRVHSGIATCIGSLAVATLAHTISMPSMTNFDAAIAQTSEMSIPMTAMVLLSLHLNGRIKTVAAHEVAHAQAAKEHVGLSSPSQRLDARVRRHHPPRRRAGD